MDLESLRIMPDWDTLDQIKDPIYTADYWLQWTPRGLACTRAAHPQGATKWGNPCFGIKKYPNTSGYSSAPKGTRLSWMVLPGNPCFGICTLPGY